VTRSASIPQYSAGFEHDPDDIEVVREGPESDFGRYRLCYQLAAGGMATVYLARAVGPGGVERPVAIKRIHPHLAKRRAFVEMFMDEARIASRINHPNICTVLDFGQHDGSYYLAMEHLLGESLNSVIHFIARREDLLGSTRWRALSARIIADACEGLHAAHRLKDSDGRPLEVVHRDLSLHNIFVTYAGAVKVLDFGIAKAATKLHRTSEGTVKGTYAYVAPEQFVGGDVDRRADVWGLGVCLWELCTGTRLFRRATEMETMLAVCSDPIPSPRTVRPDVPEALAAVIMRALSRDREERFPSARAMSQALTAFLHGCDEPTGLAELEEWMESLFGDARTTRQELAASVLSGKVLSVDPIHAQTTQLGARTDTGRSEVRVRGAAAPATAPAATPTSVPRRATWMLALAVPVAIVLGLGLALLVVGLEEGPEANPTLPAAAADSDPSPPAAPPPEPAPATVPPSSVAPREEPPNPVPETAPPAVERPVARRTGMRVRASMRAQVVEGFGSVNVSTPGGWADIYERGRNLGRSPRQVRLSAGRHVLALRPFGRTPAVRRTVEVHADSVVRLAVPVSP